VNKFPKKLDVNKFPKEVLFNLLLQVEPNEIKIVCYSKNPNVRKICNSEIFKKAYKEKYPRKLMNGPFDVATNPMDKYSFEIMKIENVKAPIILNIMAKKLGEINYISFNDYSKNYSIILYRKDGKNNMVLKPYFKYTPKNYNQEIKEYLQNIEREKWWSFDIKNEESVFSEEATMEFYNEVLDLMKESGTYKRIFK
jgi:hypothetical protein